MYEKEKLLSSENGPQFGALCGDESNKVYEKPSFEEEGMVFPEELWEEFNKGKWCFGCTNCNCN
ncbi:MAG: hypothetical protein NZ899_11175 [Thermoguttaceae bacterium]|nr:hypothetical protein [Thermoguttaceae bacterium]MDW8077753.1 hypothetical protein [Thermoguttaceae bacterium]